MFRIKTKGLLMMITTKMVSLFMTLFMMIRFHLKRKSLTLYKVKWQWRRQMLLKLKTLLGRMKPLMFQRLWN